MCNLIGSSHAVYVFIPALDEWQDDCYASLDYCLSHIAKRLGTEAYEGVSKVRIIRTDFNGNHSVILEHEIEV